MEMFLTWFRIFLAKELKQPIFYLELLVMLIAISIVNGVTVPSEDELQVGIVYTNELGAEIYDSVSSDEKSVELVSYNDEDDMKTSVKTGKIDCGFVIPEAFDGDEKIKYYLSPFTRAGEIEKEAIFAAAYQLISENILLEADREIYGDDNKERQEYLLDKNYELLTEQEVLTIDWETVGDSTSDSPQRIKPYFTQITAIVFAAMIIIVGGICFRDKTCTGSILYSVSRKQKLLMCLANDIATGVIPIVIVALSFVLSK